MPKERFLSKKFSSGSLQVIDQANRIIAEYQAQGFVLTLRQLYYQFVARGLIPNKQTEYKRLGSIISDGRLAGMIDWNAIEDRTRNLEKVATWGSPAAILDVAASSYRRDFWARQKVRPEVWIEKEALVGVIEPVCTEFGVSYFACRGYSSQSEQWRAGKRIFDNAKDFQQRTLILHLGDHDPSGIDMTRDNRDRLTLFSRAGGLGSLCDVKRLALNMDQIEEQNPPPNPAKETDSRHSSYAAQYGDESWELDALNPEFIDGLIRTEIEAVIDRKKWNVEKDRQEREIERLRDFARQAEDEEDE